MRCRRPLLVAVGCCCHRCCQRLVSVPLSEVSRLCDSTPVLPRPSPGPDCCRTWRQTGSVKGRC